MALSAGTRLGPYEILAAIGAGFLVNARVLTESDAPVTVLLNWPALIQSH